jgi:hypothetical protein
MSTSKPAREHLAANFKPGTRAFLETYRQQHGLRSWSDALRLMVNNARNELEQESQR